MSLKIETIKENKTQRFFKIRCKNYLRRVYKYKAFYLMALPGILFYVLFHYLPMYGIRIAFYEFGIMGIKKFIGVENFIELFNSPSFWQAFLNTLLLSSVNILLLMLTTIIISLLLNEITQIRFKKFVQTVIYLPHFLSWVVIASIFTLLLSPQSGIINAVIRLLGGKSIYFLTSEFWWRPVYIFVMLWRDTGWGTIVFLAALSGIDPQLYESAAMDGAGRIRQMLNITLPGIQTVIIIVLIMHLSKILNIFESVFVLYNPLVYNVSDVIGTYVYRKGLVGADYDYATAVDLFRSIISLILVLTANEISKKINEKGIF